jgi:hypothetical protein
MEEKEHKTEYFAGKRWVYERQENGSWYCDQDMTENEWQEFCDITRKRMEEGSKKGGRK